MDTLLQALQPLFATAFSPWGAPVSWLELAGCVLAIAMVVLNMRVNPAAWPLAIISSLMFFALFWNSRLYGEAGLQIVFVVVAGWGWWQWLRGHADNGQALEVRHLRPASRLKVLLTLAVAWPLIALFLDHVTDTDVPWWDAFPTAASLVGQWLLGRKYVENWPTWVVVNVVSVGLFAYKGLWFTTALYLVFVAMSFSGWRAWQRLATDR